MYPSTPIHNPGKITAELKDAGQSFFPAGPQIVYFNYYESGRPNDKYHASADRLIVAKTIFQDAAYNLVLNSEGQYNTEKSLLIEGGSLCIWPTTRVASKDRPHGMFFDLPNQSQYATGAIKQAIKIRNRTGFMIEAGTTVDLPDGTTHITEEEFIPLENFREYENSSGDVSVISAKCQKNLWLNIDSLTSPTTARLVLNNTWVKGNADVIESKFAADLWPTSDFADNHIPWIRYSWSSTVDATTGLNTGRCKPFTRPFTSYTNPQNLDPNGSSQRRYLCPYYVTCADMPRGEGRLAWGTQSSGGVVSARLLSGGEVAGYYYSRVLNPTDNYEYAIGDVVELGCSNTFNGQVLYTTTATISQRAWGYGYIDTEAYYNGPSWYDLSSGSGALIYPYTYSDDFAFSMDWDTLRLTGSGTVPNCVDRFEIDDTMLDSPIPSRYPNNPDGYPGALPMSETRGSWQWSFDKTRGIVRYGNITNITGGLRVGLVALWDDEAEENEVEVSVPPLISEYNADLPDFADPLDVKEVRCKNAYPLRVRNPDTEYVTGTIAGDSDFEITINVNIIGPWQNNRNNQP